MRGVLMAVGVLLLSASAAQAQNAAEGQKRFVVCKVCHTVESGGRHGIGPNLHGVFGAKAGTKEGFGSFSQPLRNSNIVWDEESLAKFVANPRAFIPGTLMNYAGMRQEAQVRDLIAYLKEATK